MYSALVVSSGEKSILFFKDVLKEASFDQVLCVTSCVEARRMQMQRDFDVVIINGPLKDETGEKLAKDLSINAHAQIIFIVGTMHYDQVTRAVETYGVLTISKPLNKMSFWTVLRLVNASQYRIQRIKNENKQLKAKIADIKLIDRAKCILISQMKIDEEKAHRYIEKKAMDLRCSRKEVAKEILRTYNV